LRNQKIPFLSYLVIPFSWQIFASGGFCIECGNSSIGGV
jgi:hypothetical protein